jgi:hypothetical protein
MPAYATVILVAALGAFCLALLALARRWPSHWPWLGSDREPASGEQETSRYVQVGISRRGVLEGLRARSGELPVEVIDRIEQADEERCKGILERILIAASLQELGLLDESDAAPTASHAGRT